MHQLYPQAPAPVQLVAELDPGEESVEEVAKAAYRQFCQSFDEHLFFLFCQINSERLLDYIDCRLSTDGWPLDRDEILAELYARIHGSHRVIEPGTAPLLEGSGTLYRTLTRLIDALISEQLEQLRAFSIPLPGMPAPRVAKAKGAMDKAAQWLGERGCRLKKRDLSLWVTHSILSMEVPLRKVLFLREVRKLELDAVAEAAGLSPLETARLLREAELKLKEGIEGLLDVFEHRRAIGGDGSAQMLEGGEGESEENEEEAEEEGDDDVR